MKLTQILRICNPTLGACQCFCRVENGSAAKLLTVFQRISPAKPVRYVEVLRGWGGRLWMDGMWKSLSLIDRVQVRECARNWSQSPRLANAAAILQVAIKHADTGLKQE